MIKKLLGIILFTALIIQSESNNKLNSGTWVWSCDYANKNPKLQEFFLDRSLFTDMYMYCGHKLLPGGVLELPKNYTNIIANVNLYHKNNIRFHPLVQGCYNVSILRDLVYYPDRVDTFVDMLYADAIFYNYDGYNFDFEYSDFNETDKYKFTELLEKLSIKINSGWGFNRTISTDIGSTEHPNVILDKINKTDIIAINMATYTQNFTSFTEELIHQYSTLAIKNSGVGFSCSHHSWEHPPTKRELYDRLSLVRDLGIRQVALFCSWGEVLKNWSWFESYVEILPEFV